MESQMETVNDDTVGEHFITDMVLGLAEDGIRDDIFRMDQPQLLDLPHEILLMKTSDSTVFPSHFHPQWSYGF